MFNSFRINLANEIQNFSNNFENVQMSSYSQITSTRISMYSNSVVERLTLTVFKTSTIKK